MREEFLRLEVIQMCGKVYFEDNRRLFCLKSHQKEVRQQFGWKVWVKMIVTSIEPDRAVHDCILRGLYRHFREVIVRSPKRQRHKA